MKKTLATVLLCIGAFAFSQSTKSTTVKSSPKSAAKQTTSASSTPGNASLPSRATVESFLHHVYGWDNTLKITIKDIKQSPSPSLGEVDVHVETSKGPGDSSFYITRDQKNAVIGQLVPFGGEAGKPTDAQVDAFVRKMTAGAPGMTWSVSENKPNALDDLTEVLVILTNTQGARGGQKFWVTPDGKYALVGDAGPFGASPYAATLAELKRGINGPSKGPATSPILVVEFGDLECPACKAAAPTVDRLLKDVPNAHFVFQQFPLIEIHHWAYKAAGFGDCIARENNDAFWKFMDAAYASQEDISSHVETNSAAKKPDTTYAEQKLTELATQAGMDGKKIAACAADPATGLRVDRSMALGKKVEVTGTPTLFVNGRKIGNVGGMPYDTLKAIVQFAGTPAAK